MSRYKSINPTLNNVTQEQMVKLQLLALRITGKRSVSALVRHIADHAFVQNISPDEPWGEELVVYAVDSMPMKDITENK